MSYINKLIGKKRVYLFILAIISLMSSFVMVSNAYLLKNLLGSETVSALKINGLIFVGITCLRLLLNALNRFFSELAKSSYENILKLNYFEKLLNKDYASVNKVHSSEWMNRLTSDVKVVADEFATIIPNFLGMASRIILSMSALVLLIPHLFIILVICGIILVLSTLLFRKHLKSLAKVIQEKDGKLRIFMNEHLENLLIVKSFNSQSLSVNDASLLMNQHKKARMRRNMFSNVCNIGFGVIMRFGYVLCAIVGVVDIFAGIINYSDFIAILTLVSEVQSPLGNITSFVPRYYSLLASLERLREIDGFEDDEVYGEDLAQFYRDEFTAVEFENVGFSYSDGNSKVVLSDVNFRIEKNKLAVITGESGSGKSTVLKLLMSIYPPDSGKMYIDSISGKIELTKKYRCLYAYVPQGNQLMSGSIREVLSFNDLNIKNDDEKLMAALKVCCVDQFVDSLPGKLDHKLKENGTGISEGQMQRIAIARAIVSNKPILLLDEVTSSLDEENEINLLNNLRNLKDKTIIVVTHKLKALDYCDTHIEIGNNQAGN